MYISKKKNLVAIVIPSAMAETFSVSCVWQFFFVFQNNIMSFSVISFAHIPPNPSCTDIQQKLSDQKSIQQFIIIKSKKKVDLTSCYCNSKDKQEGIFSGNFLLHHEGGHMCSDANNQCVFQYVKSDLAIAKVSSKLCNTFR